MAIIIMVMAASIGDFVLNIILKCYLSAASMVIISMNNFFALSQSEGG